MATIIEDYVSFETAKLLKEKGFNEKCRAYYKVFPESRIAAIYHSSENRGVSEDDPNEILCPTLQMAMKWLREVHNINIDIVPIWNQKQFEYQVFVVTPENAKHCYIDEKLYLVYEQACEVAIKYCLENLI